ncbi:Helix-turn-helix domain protein [Botrimarina colliarenosi]|uniref:Helix-turn-helix domain protein n=1 Tax=Botrimarina colliarenosi TaxID=2528001 RepID=A0A5C6A3U7_9BACT|nr:helix-turn-helix domain-containing protein [Botrimarina colliarenosi]TWT94070.1 Helix-turn-helix domain protein [Botrimarina colliarenosi]
MPPATYTPKQIAQALGVSESSVKRWVDSGRLPAAKTAGGHRKVPLSSIAAFVRETGHDLAEPAVLGMVATSRRPSLASSQNELYDALVDGLESRVREIVLSHYQQGESPQALGDELIGPAFRRIGESWAAGDVAVHQERRACEAMMTTLHELRRWIATPPDDAPLAIVATPPLDFAEVPPRLVELTLLAAGWRVVAAGRGLPLSEIQESVSRHAPRLVCLSVTHLESPSADFVSELNEMACPTASRDAARPRYAVGGGAITPEMATRLRCDLVATYLGELSRYQGTLVGAV